MKKYTFERHQFVIQEDGYIPLIEFADALFEIDIGSLAQIITLPPDKELFIEKKIVHNIKSRKVKIEPDPMFPQQEYGIAWEGGIHKDSFSEFVKIVRELQHQSTQWFEQYVEDYNKEVRDRNKKNKS